MPFQKSSNLPDFSRLKSTLVGTGEQTKNYLLFQTILDFLDSSEKLKGIFSKQINDLEAIVNALSSSSAGGISSSLAIDGEDGLDGFSAPGGIGPTGNTGPAGSSGGLLIGPPGLDGLDGEEGFTGLPGPQGIKGNTGGIGVYLLKHLEEGAAVTTGIKAYLSVPVDGTITKVRLFGGVSGSVVIDIFNDIFANFPPTVADTITASAKPTLSSAQSYEDTTLTGWTTSVSAGDVLAFNVDSASLFGFISIELEITAT